MEEVMAANEVEVAPKLRFPQYSGPWKKGPIGKHIDLISGVALPGNEISEEKGGVAILRGINITEGSVRHSADIDRYYHGSLEGIDHLLLKEGDLVLGMDGSKVGKNVAVISKDDEGALLIQRVARLRPKGTASIDFIYHHIFSYRFHDYVDVVNTSSGIPHISAKQIRDFEVAFPTLPEQQKIAAFLGAVDRKIQQLKRKQALLEQYKKGVVQQLFSQELRFKREDGSEYPEWGTPIPLSELVDPNRKIRYGVVQPGEYDPNGRFLIRGLDYSFGWLKSDQFFRVSDAVEQKYRKARVAEGDVILSIVGSVGNTAIIPAWLDGANITQTTARVVPDKKRLNNEFLYFLFQSPPFKVMMTRVMKSGTRQGLNIEDVENFEVSLPSLEEQTRIAGFLMALDAKVAGVARAVEAVQKWKKGLLQQMFV
jgi:type I restriction enzyme S subunit